jgi:hemin uptake protein HemP
MKSPQRSAPSETAATAPRDPIDSAVLLDGRQELNIRHGGESYVLRVTKNGKLLLTK